MKEDSSYQTGQLFLGDGSRADAVPRASFWGSGTTPITERFGTETGEAFVFRDFERSKITSIRVAIDRAPLRYSLIFICATLLWTIVVSAGAGLYGSNSIVLNTTPNVALFCVALGVFLYPPRLFWVPLLLFIAVFAYPFVNPLVSGEPWFRNRAVSLGIVVNLFFLNLLAGLIIGLLLRSFFFVAGRIWRPHLADLILSIFGFFAFVMVCLLQLLFTGSLAPALSDVDARLLGYDANLTHLAADRILRGGVVLTAFLLAAIELPTRAQFRLGLMVAASYVAIAMAHRWGLGLYPMLDVALYTLALVVVMPVPSALVAAVSGVAIYAGMTGHFLSGEMPAGPAESALENASIIVLVLIVFVLALRSRTRHLLLTKDSSMRRLNRVRDFAGVGLVSANLTTGRYRLDGAAARLLGREAVGSLSELLQSFEITARDNLTTVLSRRAASGDTLNLPLIRPDGQQMMLQILLWSETALSGDNVTYGLLLDVSEDTARKTALQSALDELLIREDRQRQMFSVISHEVRTPASVISMLVDDLGDETSPKTRRQLREATDQLLAVLGDMRQAVNPEKNLPIRPVPYLPNELAESIMASLRHTARKSEMTILLDLDPSASQPREGDTIRSRQVLTNLTRNALIHSHGTHVTLSFRGGNDASGRALSIWTVTDNGRGIPAADEATIFDPFQRGGDDSRKRADGSGLGLYIARSAVSVLGGTLDYSRPPLGGARFTVKLPEPEVDEIPEAPTPTPPAVKADAQSRILLAEDNALVAEVMLARLQRDFTRIEVVTDGQSLVAACLQNPPSVVLTDLFMPGLDGDEATRQLRAKGFNGQIIGLTAAAAGEEADRFMRAGANAVLFKPLDVAEFHRLIAQAEARQSAS